MPEAIAQTHKGERSPRICRIESHDQGENTDGMSNTYQCLAAALRLIMRQGQKRYANRRTAYKGHVCSISSMERAHRPNADGKRVLVARNQSVVEEVLQFRVPTPVQPVCL